MILIVIVILILLQIYLNTNQANIVQKFVVGITLNLPQVIQFCFLAFYTTQVRCITVILARITEHCKSLKVSDEANMSIRQMEMVYMKVFEIKMDINKVFEGPILASLFQSFHALVNEAYLIYYAELHTSDTSKATVYNNAVWITCQFIKIYWLSYSGNTLKAEALKIGEALHYMSTEGQELRWMMEVQHFSTMLKYQSMDISVFGYFSLNASLMFNMSASAMTYLIIMVQFA
ncbi:gustatory receptor for bitter taste 66a-like [Pieris brassicae]|uniref:gustatory receptor for bitter taste 66a-like n=1 Tax=Pieris brassicae TaxID=7116 RepID=UPI001E65FAF7|nr:gustatory receptor for bitter taste 66a-like [Pieris brassicae]